MLYKRKGSDCWQIKFSLNGRTIRRSAKTNDKRLAERLEHNARDEILKAELSGHKPPFSWEQATALWCDEKRDKRSLDTDLAIFKSMDEDFDGMDVSQFNAKIVSKYRTKIANRSSQSTANRHMALLRSVLRRLERLEIIDKAPNVEMYSLEVTEPAWTPPEKILEVLNALPGYARDIAEFAVLTGLRRGNVLGLKWAWVDLTRALIVVPAVSAKGKRTITVPIMDEPMAILERRKGIHEEYVFTGPGRVFGANVGIIGPLDTIKLQWGKATKAAGVPNLRFHDLRHAWASIHMMNGTPERALQEMAGWTSSKMVQRYTHLKPGTLAQYAGNVSLVSK